MTTVTAEPFGDRLMRFAIDRAIETHSLRTQLETSAPASQARSSATAALSAATAWEAAMLWVAWRLRGRRLLAGRARASSHRVIIAGLVVARQH